LRISPGGCLWLLDSYLSLALTGGLHIALTVWRGARWQRLCITIQGSRRHWQRRL